MTPEPMGREPRMPLGVAPGFIADDVPPVLVAAMAADPALPPEMEDVPVAPEVPADATADDAAMLAGAKPPDGAWPEEGAVTLAGAETSGCGTNACGVAGPKFVDAGPPAAEAGSAAATRDAKASVCGLFIGR